MRRLMLARAAAWALLLSGWIGLGSFALVLAPSVFAAFAMVALWLFALGIAAAVAPRDKLSGTSRSLVIVACAAVTSLALWWSTRGGGVSMLLVAVGAWAGLTALASGVVRSLRLALPPSAQPAPPVGAAALGALCSALVLGDIGDLQALGVRLVWLLMTSAALLCMLQHHASAQGPARRCRAGLFDCSLPAWPRGAWRDARQWATLIAGLSMLPTMAALPLMADWCRSESVAPGAMVFMHLGAMFAPALLLRSAIAAGSPRRLSTLCAVGLGAGAAAAIWLPAPWHLLGLAFAQGAAWSLAWAGQLWAPDRRSRANSSPLRAAIGYAALTLAFGALVSQFGARGVIAAHVTLGVAAVLAWLWAWALPHSDVSAAAADPVRAIR